MKELDRITGLLTLNLGRMILVSMFFPLGLIHRCPSRRGRKTAGSVSR